jgi:2-polyprenyl-3-methyl-5-hydroxy-6-metoxy-1,4-benzoquinol methylase
VQSASDQWFDEAYYQRYYFDKKTSVVDTEHVNRLGAFVCSYLSYVRVPVRRVLDVGCGIGLWREAVQRHFPGAATTAWSSASTCAGASAGSAARWWTMRRMILRSLSIW